MKFHKPGIRFLLASTVIAGFGLAAGSHTIRAESDSSSEYRTISDKWVISLAVFITDYETDAALGSGNAIGAKISIEDELGIDDDQTLFRLDGFYRFNPRHSLGFGFYSLDREGETTLTGDIKVEDVTYTINTFVQSDFDTSWLRFAWRYSFLHTDKGEAGFSLGLSMYEFDLAVEGMGEIDDPGGGLPIMGNFQTGDDFIAPIPTFGFFIRYAITPKWVFSTAGDVFHINYQDFEGDVTENSVLFEWFFSHHVGLGVGAYASRIDVKDKGTDPFAVQYDQNGILAYFTFAFGDVNR